MKYFRLGVALVVGLATAIQIHGANASSTSTIETTKEAYATFGSQRGSLQTFMDLNVAESERTTGDGSERGLHADVEILQIDNRGRMIDVAGSVETAPGAFSLEADLSGAALQIVIPVCGAKVTHNGRLIQRSFSECFDVEVVLGWAGVGEIFSADGSNEYAVGACTVHEQSSYQRRPSLATGIIRVGATNVADQSISSAIITSSRSTDATCPD